MWDTPKMTECGFLLLNFSTTINFSTFIWLSFIIFLCVFNNETPYLTLWCWNSVSTLGRKQNSALLFKFKKYRPQKKLKKIKTNVVFLTELCNTIVKMLWGRLLPWKIIMIPVNNLAVKVLTYTLKLWNLTLHFIHIIEAD